MAYLLSIRALLLENEAGLPLPWSLSAVSKARTVLVHRPTPSSSIGGLLFIIIAVRCDSSELTSNPELE
jgi:hypothetical protein